MSDNSSENSVLKNENSSDVNVKYCRLAAEYSKVRAQNSVLKKSVIEEQTKNMDLNEKLKNREQTIRKSNQEMESLNFRNKQLSKRVTILQEELHNTSKNSKKKNTASDVPNGVTNNILLDEELKKMMVENAELLSQTNIKDDQHQEEISKLKKELQSLNYELDQCNHKLKLTLAEHQLTLEQLKKEQQELKREYATKTNKLKETEIEFVTLKNAHRSYVNDVAPKLEALSQLLLKRVPFLDEEYPRLNKLNVRYLPNSSEESLHTEGLQNHFATLLITFYNIIHNVTLELKHLGFEELKIYIKTLLKEDDGVLLNEKLNACYQLLKNIGLDNNFSESMEFAVHQFIKSFLDLSSSVYSSYMSRNSEIKSAGLVDYSKNASIKNCLQTFQREKNEFINKIMNLPNSQHALVEEEFENLNIAIKKLISEIDGVDQKRLQCNNRKSTDTYPFKKQASSYLRSLKKEKFDLVPYEEAIENKKKLQECIMLNNVLKDELNKVEKMVTTLEQEKKLLENENKIIQIKCDSNKTNEIILNLEDGVRESTNEIGKIISPHDISAEIIAREKEITRYLNEKIDEVIVSKQEASSRARNFLLECKALQRRLENCIVEKQLLENKHLKSNKTVSELREELSTVTQNYELQLSTMSEHLASVNEKLASQSEEIDNLHYQSNNKVLKKTKQK